MTVEFQNFPEVFRNIGIVVEGIHLKDGDEASLTAVEAVKVIEKGVPGVFEVVIQFRRGEKVAYKAVILLPGLGDQGDFDKTMTSNGSIAISRSLGL